MIRKILRRLLKTLNTILSISFVRNKFKRQKEFQKGYRDSKAVDGGKFVFKKTRTLFLIFKNVIHMSRVTSKQLDC